MNSIKKQKSMLIGLGVLFVVISVLFLVFGILLTLTGIKNISNAIGIVKLVFGILMIILFVPAGWTGIKFIWVGSVLTATIGSIKQANIAKEGGTVNMKKCDKCGTEIKDGETECSNCGKPVKD